jgi:23S rRNA (uracil1939-C5)-methyltransferase
MARKSRPTVPVELQILGLEPGNLGVGLSGERKVAIRGVPPGALVRAWPIKKRRGVLYARRETILEAPSGAVTPRCAVFSVCGGCALQEIPAEAQRQAKLDMVLRHVGSCEGVRVHPVRWAGPDYGYRNKVELSYGNHRFLSHAEHQYGTPNEGRFLGFHSPDRFDRIVSFDRCEVALEPMNALLAPSREHLSRSSFECWDARLLTGFWRHLLLRASLGRHRSGDEDEVLAAVFTTPPPPDRETEARHEVSSLAGALRAKGAGSVVWFVNETTADAALGRPVEVFGGEPFIEEHLHLRLPRGPRDLRFRLSPTSFFQANTLAAEQLYEVVAEAAGQGRLLLDLYCGTGAIGIALAPSFDDVLGVDVHPESIADARQNAARNGVCNICFETGRVEERIGRLLAGRPAADAVAVVDPPRVGLHPDSARWLADLACERLVYVACHAPSLGRDRAVLDAGGWQLRDLWVVDLFPQTGHVETIGLFRRA